MSTKIAIILEKHGSMNIKSIRYYLSYDYDIIVGIHYNHDDIAYIIQGMIRDEIIKGSKTGYYSLV